MRFGRLQSSMDPAARESGHVAVIMALTLLPLAAIAGFAVDWQLLTTKKNKAQYSLDSAVIAGSRLMQQGGDPQTIKAEVKKYFAASLAAEGSILNCGDPKVTILNYDINAEVICTQDTTLSAVAGVDELAFRIESASTFGVGKIDVSFVFDVSGSMQGDRMDQLKAAAKEAIDQLIPEEETDETGELARDIRLSMVAYNNSLNAGDLFEEATGTDEDQSFQYYSSYYRRWFTVNWSTTCVFERRGDEAYTDAAPDPGQFITPANYNTKSECRNSKPLTLTTDKTALKAYVTALNPNGGTAGHLGVAWGWYMISPEWKYILPLAPHDYDEPDTAKALILMTDGDFNSELDGSASSSEQARKLCDNIKSKGIIIYSVAFQAPSAGRAVLNYCSSGAEYYFNPQNGEELTQSYQAIATSISDLRITK